MLGYNDFLIAFIGQIGFVVLILTIRVLICSSEFSYTCLEFLESLLRIVPSFKFSLPPFSLYLSPPP